MEADYHRCFICSIGDFADFGAAGVFVIFLG